MNDIDTNLHRLIFVLITMTQNKRNVMMFNNGGSVTLSKILYLLISARYKNNYANILHKK